MPAPPPEVPTEEASCAVCGATGGEVVGRNVDFEYATCSNEFAYVRCGTCGLVYLKNRPVPAALGTIYPPSYGNYDGDRSRALTFRVKSWLDGRGIRRLAARTGRTPRRVLDVGCADGRLLDVCRGALPGALDLEGVEISEEAARGAIAKGYRVSVGTVDELELPEGRYDLIFLQQVIEHVYAPRDVVEKLARSLAPGGLLVLDTPTTDCLDFRLLKRRYWGGYHAPRHFHLFTEATLVRLCTESGLVHEATRYSPQPIHWVWSLHHYLAEKGFPRWSHGWLNLRNPLAIGSFTVVELLAGLATRRMSNMQVAARRPA